jgi:hypothetical protein
MVGNSRERDNLRIELLIVKVINKLQLFSSHDTLLVEEGIMSIQNHALVKRITKVLRKFEKKTLPKFSKEILMPLLLCETESLAMT